MRTFFIERDDQSLTPDAQHLIKLVDVSGSMTYNLPPLCQEIKANITKLLRPGDLFSLIWFSGKGQCDLLIDAQPIRGLQDLSEINSSIDTWLRPQGLTGFKSPLELTLKSVLRNSVRSDWRGSQVIQFLSDGHDNQSSRKEILAACAALADTIDHATVVEYGHYADRTLLSEMAAVLGGSLIFAEDHQAYVPHLHAFLGHTPGALRRSVKVDAAPGSTVLAMQGDEILQFLVSEQGEVRVPADVTSLGVLTGGGGAVSSGTTDSGDDLALVYAALSVAASRMDGDLTEALLTELGDVRLVRMYRTVIGKQRFADFAEEARKAAFDPALRLSEGADRNVDFNTDELNVLEVMDLLARDPAVRVMLHDKAFRYSRIGAAREEADGATETEKKQIKELTDQIVARKPRAEAGDPASGTPEEAAAMTTLQEKLQEIQSRVQTGAKFTADPTPDGQPLGSLVWNRDLPNLSFNTTRRGVLTFEQVPDGLSLPASIATQQIRTYTVIKDGLVNIQTLPVRMGRASYEHLKSRGLALGEWSPEATYLLPLRDLPVISRASLGEARLQDLADAQAKLTSLQGSTKVYKDLLTRHFPPRTSEGLAQRFGENEAVFLRSLGLTDSGFAPPSNTVPSGDVRPITELKLSVKDLSSLPKVSDAEAAMVAERQAPGKKKITPGKLLLIPALNAHENFVAGHAPGAEGTAAMKSWLDGQLAEARQQTARLEYELARSKFALLVGRRWFSDSAGPEDDTREAWIQPGLLPGETGVPGWKTPVTAKVGERELAI